MTGGATSSGKSPNKELDYIVESLITTTKEAANADDSINGVRLQEKFRPVTVRTKELGSASGGLGLSWVVTTGLGVVVLCYSCWIKVLGVVCRLRYVLVVKALKQYDLNMWMSATPGKKQMEVVLVVQQAMKTVTLTTKERT